MGCFETNSFEVIAGKIFHQALARGFGTLIATDFELFSVFRMMDQLPPEGVVFAFHDICHSTRHNNLKIIKVFGIGIADIEQEDSKKTARIFKNNALNSTRKIIFHHFFPFYKARLGHTCLSLSLLISTNKF